MKCLKCQKDIVNEDFISCNGNCKGDFHLQCAKIQLRTFKKMSLIKKREWICSDCEEFDFKNIQIEFNEKITNEKSKRDNADMEFANVEINSLSDLYMKLRSHAKKDNEELNDKMDKMTNYLQKMSIEISNNKKLIKTNMDDIDNLKEQIYDLNKQNELLNKELSEATRDIIDLNQYSRKLNLEINGIYESPNEQLENIFITIGDILEVPLKKEDIQAIHRVPSNRAIRPIIVQLKNLSLKMLILKKCKRARLSCKKLNPDWIDTFFYINEHLVPQNKRLFAVCKEFKKSKNFKYLWYKNGKIFLRETDDSKINKIMDITDLDKLIPIKK